MPIAKNILALCMDLVENGCRYTTNYSPVNANYKSQPKDDFHTVQKKAAFKDRILQ